MSRNHQPEINNCHSQQGRDDRFDSPWLDTWKAASYLSCNYGTLKVWRAQGKGPRYHIVNEKLIRYHVDDLDAFIRGGDAR